MAEISDLGAGDGRGGPVAVARSPIPVQPPVGNVSGWEVSLARSAAPLTLADWTPLAKVLRHSTPETGAPPFGRAARDADGVLVVGWAPGHWLLLGPPGSAQDLVAGRDDAVDLTSALAVLRLTGSHIPELLAKVCAVDLAGASDGTVVRSSVARVAAGIVRDDRPNGDPSYLLGCDRSLGAYLHGALLDAGAEFGLEPTGFHLG